MDLFKAIFEDGGADDSDAGEADSADEGGQADEEPARPHKEPRGQQEVCCTGDRSHASGHFGKSGLRTRVSTSTVCVRAVPMQEAAAMERVTTPEAKVSGAAEATPSAPSDGGLAAAATKAPAGEEASPALPSQPPPPPPPQPPPVSAIEFLQSLSITEKALPARASALAAPVAMGGASTEAGAGAGASGNGSGGAPSGPALKKVVEDYLNSKLMPLIGPLLALHKVAPGAPHASSLQNGGESTA